MIDEDELRGWWANCPAWRENYLLSPCPFPELGYDVEYIFGPESVMGGEFAIVHCAGCGLAFKVRVSELPILTARKFINGEWK